MKLLFSAKAVKHFEQLRNDPSKKRVAPKTYYGWVKRYPIAKEANEFAKTIIGNRREVGALKRKFDVGMFTASMPMYSDEWKENVEWKSSLKHKEHHNEGNITVVLPSIDELAQKKVFNRSSKEPIN